jgi:uncharacterized protein YcbK (DUF882 family)
LVLRSRGLLAGLAAALLGMSAGSPQIVAAFGTTRTISLYHIHTKETLTVTYKKAGRYLPDALKKINWLMRDWRENDVIDIDPKTIDLLWEMHTELGSKEPIHIICGHRSDTTNKMLRRTRGGQAKRSYHLTGKAIDAAFPDIPVKQLRYSALIRERGGVGYYPTSGIPFVHVDSGPVRAWPRLPRYELALLFPNGRTQHKPASGGPLTPKDVLVARAHHKELAAQVAAYFDTHNHRKAPVQVAWAAAPALEAPAPRPAHRSESGVQVASLAPNIPAPTPEPAPQFAQATLAPSATERGRLDELVSLASLTADAPTYRPAPVDRSKLEALIATSLAGNRATEQARAAPAAERVAALEPQAPASIEDVLSKTQAAGWNTGWAPAPEFDDDHPEELTYRPFPIAPFLTQSASADDRDLVRLVHPDVVRTLDLLDDRQTVLPLRLRPGRQITEMMWTRELKGDAVDVSGLEEARRARSAPSSLASRAVRTTAR